MLCHLPDLCFHGLTMEDLIPPVDPQSVVWPALRRVL